MMQVLEYDEDLRYYWTAGYGGDDVSYTPACTLLADALRHLVYVVCMQRAHTAYCSSGHYKDTLKCKAAPTTR